MYSNSVFVVGSYRSGTSLLYSLLNQHPEIALMYECDVWDFPEPFARLRFRRGWLERQEFFNQALSRHRLILGSRLNGLECVRTPEELYRCFSKGKHASLWGEKSPVYCARLRQLARHCPGGAFILLWRDPMDIYRSIVSAGHQERFFRRPGLLNWLIFCREKMIQQAATLSQAGARIHHVTYDELVDQTEKVCRNLCRFLEIEFHPAMLNLGTADFSAIFPVPHHNHLRRGLIERRRLSGEVLAAPAVRKLQRYRNRWNRLENYRLGIPNNSPAGPEPGWSELLYHKAAGSLFYLGCNAKRALFEFLPLTWLRTYRLTKNWFLGKRTAASTTQPSLAEDWSHHWITILISALVLAAVAWADFATGPQITLAPFYAIPCAALALVVGLRWATPAAFFSAILFTWGRMQGAEPSYQLGLLAWNTTMRFVLFQVIVVLLDRIRVEMNSTLNSASDKPS